MNTIALVIAIAAGVLLAVGLGVLRMRITKRQMAPVPAPEPDRGRVSGRLLDHETLTRIGDRRFGRPVRRRYLPEQFLHPINCVTCKRELIPGQYFWETPLLDRKTGADTGDNFAICTGCQPGDATEVNRG